MTDYGHDLLFGSFLTPSAGEAAHVVRLAVLPEQVGLDLVTVQDHPYQPSFLDTGRCCRTSPHGPSGYGWPHLSYEERQLVEPLARLGLS